MNLQISLLYEKPTNMFAYNKQMLRSQCRKPFPAVWRRNAPASESKLIRNFDLEGRSEKITHNIWLGESGYRPNQRIQL